MKQPHALIPLFLTEMWERFGFYIIEGLLVIYMTTSLDFSDIKSYALLGEFTALAYISPVIGGLIADRILGFRYSILTSFIRMLFFTIVFWHWLFLLLFLRYILG